MRNRITVGAAVVATALAITGCGQKTAYQPKPVEKVAPVTINEGNQATLFPLKTGNQWVYQLEAVQQGAERGTKLDDEVTLRVKSATTQGDTTTAVVEIVRDGNVEESNEWELGPSGLHQLSSGRGEVRTEFNPKLPVIVFPVTDGQETKFTGTGHRSGAPTPGAFTATIRTLGVQEVDTATGRMSALGVENVTSYTVTGQDAQGKTGPIEIRSQTTSYWSPGVGLVRMRMNLVSPHARGAQTLVLKSSSLKP